MTIRIPLKFGCVATIDSDEIDRPQSAAPLTQPVLPHDDRCLCLQCRTAPTKAAAK